MTPEQCKAARILAMIDGDALAAVAGVDLNAIRAFESGVTRSDAELAARLALVLENLGVRSRYQAQVRSRRNTAA